MLLSPLSRRPRNRSRTGRLAPPRLEALEARDVPSTLTVRTAADSGPGSLRAAVGAAHPGDTIVFDRKLAGAVITLSGGELAIAKSLSIAGPGASLLAVSGGGVGRVFDIAAGAVVGISGLAVSGGLADAGGGILNAGSLTLNGVTVSGNEALGDSAATGVGGGLFNEPGASLAVSGCLFINNQVVGGTAGLGYGGGLFNEGTATLTARLALF
jgi:hypothetical protein